MNHECERNEMLLSTCLDGEDRAADRLELLDHLARCRDCRDFYLEARALGGLAAAVRPPAADASPGRDRWERIRAAAVPQSSSIRRRPAVPAWALRAAAFLVVAAGLAFALGRPARVLPAAGASVVEVVLEEDAEAMTESRFVELTTEVLRADRRYHQAMFRVMEQVVSDTGRAGTAGETKVRERDERGELESETESRGESARGRELV